MNYKKRINVPTEPPIMRTIFTESDVPNPLPTTKMELARIAWYLNLNTPLGVIADVLNCPVEAVESLIEHYSYRGEAPLSRFYEKRRRAA